MSLSFSNSNASKALPSKTHINLCLKEKSKINPLVAFVSIIAIIIFAAVFSKFAVLDRMSEVDRLNGEVTSREYLIEEMNKLLESYDEVYAEYSRYSVSWMNDTERYMVPRTDVFDLVDNVIAKSASVGRISINNNNVSVELVNTTLSDTSALVAELKALDNVKDVVVYTASSNDGETSMVSLVFSMISEEEVAE